MSRRPSTTVGRGGGWRRLMKASNVHSRVFAAAWLMLGVALATPMVTDAAAGKDVKYVSPTGFDGRTWGELRRTFDRLPAEPLGVGAGFILPVEKATTFTCVLSTGVDGCDFQATLLRIYKEYEGGGFYVLSEYAIPDQGFRMGDERDGVLLHPVVYQFCANWSDSIRNKEVPPNFDDINKFCGMRLQFQSESREQLARLPADHVTVYDRMVTQLIGKFGRPRGFLRRGQVIIETEEGATGNASERKFSIWRWCPAEGNGFNTNCKASVTLSINPATGLGTLLYSTPMVWEYAAARETNQKGDRLYRLLHARRQLNARAEK
jgi:hypothetical protein